jgi:hypothetical protein
MPRRPPGAVPGSQEAPPLLSPLYLAHPLSLPCATSQTPSTPPWPLPTAAVLRLPELPRCALQVRLAALFLPLDGIGPRWPKSPPPVAVSPLVVRARRRRIRRRRSISGQADPAGDSLVNFRSSWASSQPSLCPADAAGEPAGFQYAMAVGSWPLANVACHVGHGPQRSEIVGQNDPGAFSSCCSILFLGISENAQNL